jgi:dephospho-CoA kinase
MQAVPTLMVCVTGGAATGKSTVTRRLGELLPAEVFDADACVHEMFAGDAVVIAALRERFPSACKEEGIDRRELGRIVFESAEDRKFLEGLLHPRVYARCDSLWSECRQRGRNLVAEIPLLFETGEESRYPVVVLVAASREVQMKRLMDLRGLDKPRAMRVLDAQWPIEKKVSAADFVIWNDGSREVLEQQIGQVAKRLQRCGG